MIKIEHSPNNQKVFLNIQNSRHNFKTGIRKALWDLGNDLVKTAKDGIIRGSHTGRIYNIGGIKHQSGGAGEYPANRRPAIRKALKQPVNPDARLAYSLGFNVVGSTEMHFGSKVPHGEWLQEGTKNMKPRPFLTLAVNSNEQKAIRLFQNEIGKRL